MPRKEINYDDDEAVERLLHREEVAKEKKRDAEAKKSVAGKNSSEVLAMIAEDVDTITRNIIAGDSPYPIREAYVFVSDPDFTTYSAVRVLAVQESRELTPDAAIFDKLCAEKELFFTISDDLDKIRSSKKYKTLEAAMPALVKVGITKKLIRSADKDRLTTLYTHWMKGVDWSNTFKHGTNRPSLASWNGWPWDAYVYKERALNHGITSKIVEAIIEDEGPEGLVQPEDVGIFKRIWTKDEGPVKDVVGVLRAAIKEAKEAMEREEAGKGNKKRKRA